MGLRTILFALVMLACSAGLVLSPVWPICGYILHYSTGPEKQWWAAPINTLGIRYSFTLGILCMVAVGLHADRLQRAKPMVTRTEWLMLAFLALVWFVAAIAPATVGRYTLPGIDHPTVKLTKVLIFVMIVTHVAVTKRDLSIVLWAMMIGGLILGLEAYDTPRRSFVSGRLEGVGGPDFGDANRLAGYMVGLLPIIGVFFLHSGWRGRAALFLAGGFVANTIVLTRCRGAVLGLAVASVVTLVLVPRVYRARLSLAMLVGMAGFLYLSDDQFLHRSSTITASAEERDSSAQARFDLAVAGTKMAIRNPLGVGPGNFYQNVGKYDARYEGRDAHSTFTRCLGELGFPGLLLFVAILCSSFGGLRRVLKEAAHLPEQEERYYRWTAIGITAGIVAAFGYGMTGTLLYTEYAWWLLALPICLERALTNTKRELELQEARELEGGVVEVESEAPELVGAGA